MIVEAKQITVYVATNRPKGWRKGKPRRQRGLAYRDAAWAKIRARCGCSYPEDFGEVPKRCRFHDREFRATPSRWGGDQESPPDPPSFNPPEVWGLPRTNEEGLWDYGRAVAFRLARFYRYLDSRPAAPPSETPDGKEP